MQVRNIAQSRLDGRHQKRLAGRRQWAAVKARMLQQEMAHHDRFNREDGPRMHAEFEEALGIPEDQRTPYEPRPFRSMWFSPPPTRQELAEMNAIRREMDEVDPRDPNDGRGVNTIASFAYEIIRGAKQQARMKARVDAGLPAIEVKPEDYPVEQPGLMVPAHVIRRAFAATQE